MAEKDPKAPSMTRSRTQLSTVYAPGAFFTFEGGLGACYSIPDQDERPDKADIAAETKEQILLRLKEVWQSWLKRALTAGTATSPAKPQQCLDARLLRDGRLHPLGGADVEFVNPRRMGYIPAPLAFVCNTCGLFKSFESCHEFDKGSAQMEPDNCSNPKGKGNCQWRQLDVIFVHWSGNWEAAGPGMWEWNKEKQKVWRNERCSLCDSPLFFLRDKSPRISEWVFECAGCGHKERDTWLQNDKDTTEILGDECETQPVGERRMEAISYRASAAFYPQWEQFIVFDEENRRLLQLLHEGNETNLADFIAGEYGFGAVYPSPEESLEILGRAGLIAEADTYRHLQKVKSLAEGMKDAEMVAATNRELAKTVAKWRTSGLVPGKRELPRQLTASIQARAGFTSRYDPFVLAVEHFALNKNRLSKTTSSDGRTPYVRFVAMDNDLAPKDPDKKRRQQDETQVELRRLGIADMGLIREFELCRFTHGYSRVSPVPTMEKRGNDVPVRLKLFDQLGNRKRPIYVVTQKNEAFHVRLDAERVYQWLRALDVQDSFEWDPGGDMKLGAHVLMLAEPFGRFFSQLTPGPAKTYRYVYTLLHTYAHVLMKSIAEFSGLDVGSLGEYLFPADLSFVVYRSGTTMDLGNLSSLWRNENNRFLRHLIERKTLLCNSGSLCDSSGSACPDCIMVPETSCIVSNQLLSRSVLLGGPAPREDLSHRNQVIRGYLQIVNDAPAAL